MITGTLFDRKNCGEFFDASTHKRVMGWRIQRFAKDLGWSGKVLTSDMEDYEKSTIDAVVFLNTLCTKDVEFVLSKKGLALAIKDGYEGKAPEEATGIKHVERVVEEPTPDAMVTAVKEVGAAYLELKDIIFDMTDRHSHKALLTALVNHTGVMFRVLREQGLICEEHIPDFVKSIEVIAGLRPRSELHGYVELASNPELQERMKAAFTEVIEEHTGEPLTDKEKAEVEFIDVSNNKITKH